jgi:small subunit ribosomal protein S20
MANTASAKKNIRSSARKKAHNTMWKKAVREIVKSIKAEIATKSAKIEDLTKKLHALQKAADKAVKEKVIHKNKSNRLKSIYARKISALFSGTTTKSAKPARSAKSAK